GGSVALSVNASPDGASDCVWAGGFCCVTGWIKETDSGNFCRLSQGIGGTATAAFSSGGTSVTGSGGAATACAIAPDESRSFCRDVFCARPLSVFRYQHWRPLLAWSMRKNQC